MSEVPTGGAASAGAIKATVDFDAAGLERAVNKAMVKATGQIERTIDKSMAEVQSTMSSGFRKVGGGILAFLGIGDVVSGLRSVVGWVNEIGEETERGLNTFRAVSGATADEMERVSDVATQLGNDISLPGTSAADAAVAMTELAKAGFSVDEAMEAAKGTLQLATAAQIDAGDAAEISSKQLQAFQLDTSEAGHVADILANAANATSADMQGMADSLNQAGAVAHASGFTFTETAAAVALMADNAIVGSDAGTSLKSMLVALQAPSDKARGIMQDLGIEVYDANGHMKTLAGITAELTEGTKGLTDEQKQYALATIFGTDAIRTVNVLMNQGADGLREMSDRLEEEGAAAKLAAANSHGLVGSLGALQSTAESLAIEIYQNVSPAIDEWLRGRLEDLPGVLEDAEHYLSQMGDALDPLVSLVYNFMQAAEPGTIVAFKAALAATLGVVEALGTAVEPLNALIEGNEDAFRKIVSAVIAATFAYKVMTSVVNKAQDVYTSPQWSAARANVNSLKTSLKSASGVVSQFKNVSKSAFAALGGPWGIAIAAGATAIGAYAQGQAEAAANADELRDSLNEQTGAITENTRAVIAKRLEDEGVLEAANKVGLALDTVTDAALGNKAALHEVATGYVENYNALTGLDDEARNTAQETADAWDKVKNAVSSQTGLVADAREEHDRLAEAVHGSAQAADDATAPTERMAGAAGRAGVAYEDEADAADHATRAIRGLNSEVLEGIDAQISFEQASDDLRGVIRELAPDAIKSGKALDLNYESGRQVYSAFVDLANASSQVDGGMAAAREQIFDTIRPMVDSKAEAKRLTDQFFDLRNAANQVPNNVRVHVEADVEGAMSRLHTFMQAVANANNSTVSGGVPFVSGATVRGNAGGGAIYGAGTGTSDDVLRRLSSGEHVFTAKEVDAAGGQGGIYAIRAALRRGGLPALAALADGGGGALVDNLSVAVGTKDDLPEAMGEVLFHLRRLRRGSRRY